MGPKGGMHSCWPELRGGEWGWQGYREAEESLKEEGGSSWDDTDRHFPPQDALLLSSLPLQLQKQKLQLASGPQRAF